MICKAPPREEDLNLPLRRGQRKGAARGMVGYQEMRVENLKDRCEIGHSVGHSSVRGRERDHMQKCKELSG
jgi:hypothetical protein